MTLKGTMGSQRGSRRAFTLVELLVVVGVLVTLTALTALAIRTARGTARAGQCAGHLRQLGLATQGYLATFGDKFWRYYTTVPEGRRWWFGLEPGGPGSGTNRPLLVNQSPLATFAADWAADRLLCPEFPYDDPAYFAKFATPAASYGYNWRLGPVPLSKQPVNRLGLPNPGRVFVFADAIHFDFGTTFNEGHYIAWMAAANLANGYAHFRHDGQAAAVFADGHVQSLPQTGPWYRQVGGGRAANLTDDTGSDRLYGPP